jgi:hypothetical protein
LRHPLTQEDIDPYCTLDGYDWQAFCELLIRVSAFIPCLLCGEVHLLSIHARLWRTVRSPEEGQNIEIVIIAIICLKAKEVGRQYTKRILPPFVIPYCVISREAVLAYLRRFPDGRIHYRIASPMLGAVDMRTIRRHIADALDLISEATLQITLVLSQLPSYATVPQRRVGESEMASLGKAVEEMHRASRRVRGGSAPQIPPVVYIHAVGVYSRARNPLVPPLGLVLRAAVFHDTS